MINKPSNDLIGEFRNIAHSGDAEAMLSFIRSSGLGPAHTEKDGANSALMLAVDSGSIDVVRLLLEQGADASYATDEGETPFECACVVGSAEICRILKDHGASPFTRNRYGVSPEDYAVHHGHLDVVDLLRSWR